MTLEMINKKIREIKAKDKAQCKLENFIDFGIQNSTQEALEESYRRVKSWREQ
jgi:hypothetical protein